MAKNYAMNMCSGPLAPKIIKFTIPLILSSVLALLYHAADIIVVGRFAGSTALSAVGSTSSLINLIVNIFIALSGGVNIILAQAIGANEPDKCQKVIHTSILASGIFGLFLAITGMFISRPLLQLTDAPADVIDQATLYMQIYFLGSPGRLVYTFAGTVMRAFGDTKRPLIFQSISGILNVILNLVAVICFHMGVAGVAIATITSEFVSAILVILTLTKANDNSRLDLKKLKIDGKILFDMLKVGLPVSIQTSTFSLSNVIIQSSINSFGSDAVAGNAAAANIEGFIYVIIHAINMAAVTFVGQNYGAKEFKRVRKSVIWCVLFASIIGTILGPLMYTFGKPLIGIYCPDNANAVQYGLIRMQYVTLLYVIYSIDHVFSGAIRGTGNTTFPMLSSICGICGVRILWVLIILPHIHSLPSLYVSYPISWSITLLADFVYYLYIRKKRLQIPVS